MMKKKIAGAVLVASVVAGVGTGVVANAMTADDRLAPGASGSPSASATPAGPDDLQLGPGAVGPVRIGMSQQQAVDTGLFVADVAPPTEGCPLEPLAWFDPYNRVFDVYTLGNGEISSIGVREPGPVTADGLGVGSTYAEVRKVDPSAAVDEAGFGQSGISMFDQKTGGWIGFLFDVPPADLRPGDQATFVEITKGGKPDLMRSGC